MCVCIIFYLSVPLSHTLALWQPIQFYFTPVLCLFLFLFTATGNSFFVLLTLPRYNVVVGVVDDIKRECKCIWYFSVFLESISLLLVENGISLLPIKCGGLTVHKQWISVNRQRTIVVQFSHLLSIIWWIISLDGVPAFAYIYWTSWIACAFLQHFFMLFLTVFFQFPGVCFSMIFKTL